MPPTIHLAKLNTSNRSTDSRTQSPMPTITLEEHFVTESFLWATRSVSDPSPADLEKAVLGDALYCFISKPAASVGTKCSRAQVSRGVEDERMIL